jgi:predicted CXXCH cytochrome family protein
MTFLLRHISFTADHREIVRTTRLDGDSVTIGRGAENDISLPDLGVDPNHARIERRTDRRIAVVALGTLGFEIDGRTTRRGDIDAAKGAELKFGGHRITVTRDAEGQVVLTVERVDAVSDTAEDRDEAAAYSLKGLLPGRRMTAWLLAIAVLVGFLALPIWSFVSHSREDTRSIYAFKTDRSWSSGPLSAAHHGLESNCTACHQQAFVSVRDDSCKACHKDVHDHAPPARLAGARAVPGFTGAILGRIARAFGKPDMGACVDCHREHEGAGPMPPTPQAFCSDCHGTLESRLADTKIPNAGDFGTAHPQFRPLVAVQPGARPVLARASLDAPPIEQNDLKFPHKLHLDAFNGVARMAQTMKARNGFGDKLVCADCHTPSADGTRFLPITMERNCQMCHSLGFDRIGGTIRTLRHGDVPQMEADIRAMYRSTSPPAPAGLSSARRRPGVYAQGKVYHAYFGAVATRPGNAEAAITAVFSKGGACFDCHIVTPPGVGGAADWTVLPVHQPMRYMMHGWFDHAAHRTETCESCHNAQQSASASDLLLPGIKTCRTCHGGENAAAKVPSSCAMCHSYHADSNAPWLPRASRQRIRGLPSTVAAGGVATN